MIPLVPTITKLSQANVSLINQYATAINAISAAVGSDPAARAMALQAFDLASDAPKQLKYAQAVTLYKKDGTTAWATTDNTLPVTLKAQQSQAKGDVLCTDASQALYLKMNEDETATAGLICNPESAPSAGDGSIIGWIQGDHTEPVPGMSGKFYDGYVLVGAGGTGAADGTGGATLRGGGSGKLMFAKVTAMFDSGGGAWTTVVANNGTYPYYASANPSLSDGTGVDATTTIYIALNSKTSEAPKLVSAVGEILGYVEGDGNLTYNTHPIDGHAIDGRGCWHGAGGTGGSTIGAASEGLEPAETSTWLFTTQAGTGGLDLFMFSRVAYFDTGTQTLYGYVRKLTFDSEGRLSGVSAETRVSIDVPSGPCV